MKRVFLMVLDSVGIGEMPDAAQYGDAGSNTLAAASKSPYFSMPICRSLAFLISMALPAVRRWSTLRQRLHA